MTVSRTNLTGKMALDDNLQYLTQNIQSNFS